MVEISQFILSYSSTGMEDDPQILFLVKSALPNYEKRLAIRRTWGDEQRILFFEFGINIRTVFLVGTSPNWYHQLKLDEEDAKFGDIVQSDFLDTYNNLTIKTMSGLKWAFDHCPNASYVVFASNFKDDLINYIYYYILILILDDNIYLSTYNLLLFVRSWKTYPVLREMLPVVWKTEKKLYAGPFQIIEYNLKQFQFLKMSFYLFQ